MMSSRMPTVSLARVLLSAAVADTATLGQASAIAAEGGVSLAHALARWRLVDAAAMGAALGAVLGRAPTPLADVSAPPALAVPRSVCARLRVLPLSRRADVVTLGMTDPTDDDAVAQVADAFGVMIERVLVDDDDLERALRRVFPRPDELSGAASRPRSRPSIPVEAVPPFVAPPPPPPLLAALDAGPGAPSPWSATAAAPSPTKPPDTLALTRVTSPAMLPPGALRGDDSVAAAPLADVSMEPLTMLAPVGQASVAADDDLFSVEEPSADAGSEVFQSTAPPRAPSPGRRVSSLPTRAVDVPVELTRPVPVPSLPAASADDDTTRATPPLRRPGSSSGRVPIAAAPSSTTTAPRAPAPSPAPSPASAPPRGPAHASGVPTTTFDVPVSAPATLAASPSASSPRGGTHEHTVPSNLLAWVTLLVVARDQAAAAVTAGLEPMLRDLAVVPHLDDVGAVLAQRSYNAVVVVDGPDTGCSAVGLAAVAARLKRGAFVVSHNPELTRVPGVRLLAPDPRGDVVGVIVAALHATARG
jgi:hypothetical protein